MLFPSFPLLCNISIKRWTIEVVEAQVEESVSLVHRSADKVCHYCISDLLIEIYFLVQFMCILNMNIESMDVFNFLHTIDYIFYISANTFIYIMLALFIVVESKL